MPFLRPLPFFIYALVSLVGCGKTGQMASRVSLNDKAGPTTTTPGGGAPQGSPTSAPVTGGTWYAGGGLSGGATLDANHILRGPAAGTFTSAVVDAGGSKKLSRLSAASPRPVGAQLPDNRGADPNTFTKGRIDTIALNLFSLYHLGASPFGTDTSSFAHVGTAIGALSGVSGLFGRSAMHTGGYLRVPPAGAITFGGAFAVSLWFRTTAQSGVLFAQRDPNGFDGAISIGLNQDVPLGPAGIAGQLSFWMYGNASSGSIQSTSAGGVNDGQWHHLVAIRDTLTGRAAMSLYLDGQLNAQSLNETLIQPRPLAIGIGADPRDAGTVFDGDLQELAVMGSAPSASTVKNLYLRGNGGIGLQVRACATANCGDAAFVGPDGTAATYFSTLDNSLAALNLVGRYFQFKVKLAPVLDEVPVITNVTLETDPN